MDSEQTYKGTDDLTLNDAIDLLDGHGILKVEAAKKVCELIGVTFDEEMVMSWQTAEEAQQKYDFFATKAPAEGVDALLLSYHITRALGLGTPGWRFTGKGYQAAENRQAIHRKLTELGKL